MRVSKQPYTFLIDPEQLERLKAIASVSRGRPKVSGLIREAIEEYIAAAASKDRAIAEALRPKLRAIRANSTTERGA